MSPISGVDRGPKCQSCKIIAIKVYDIDGKKVCRNCKRVANGKAAKGPLKNKYPDPVPDLFGGIGV